MLIYCLIFLIALAAMMIKGEKKAPLMIFIIPAIAFQIAAFGIADYIFHLTASVLDLVVIMLLLYFGRFNAMVLFIGSISVFSIFTNIFGWMLYENGFGSSVYDGVFSAIYALVLFVSLMEWWSCARKSRNDSRVFGGCV